MPKKSKEEGSGRLGVPPVKEAYQEMQNSSEFEAEVARRGRKKDEKVNWHLEHEKTRDYERHLPPAEERISEERPPFKKR